MNTDSADIKRETALTTFFWWCSGAEVDILRELPSERQKYFSIGTIVFFTALFAVLSGTYAFISAFGNAVLGISFGIMWGILIFTLHRYALSTVVKTSASRKTLFSAVPSLFISVLISIVISTPLTLRIFEKQIRLEKSEQVHQHIFSVNSKYGKQQEDIKQQIGTLRSEIQRKNEETRMRLSEYIDELRGNSSSRIKGIGDIAEFKKRLYEDSKRDYAITKNQNDSLISSLNSQLLFLSEKMRSTEDISLSQMTFIDMLQTFSDLRKKDPTIFYISYFLSLFILLISTTPIIIQVLSKAGPYNEYVLIRDKIQINKFAANKQGKSNDNEQLQIEAQELRNKFSDVGTAKIDEWIEELAEQKKSTYQKVGFQNYFLLIADSLSAEAEKIEKKGKDFFRQGMIFSIIGIIIAFGFLIFWLNYFSIKKFELYDVFSLISGTIIILLIEFLGAWFLKQYRVSSDKTLHILKIKTIVNRYILIYLAIDEFAPSGKGEAYLAQLISTLDKDLRFPPDPSNAKNTSFTEEAFSSIGNLTDTIRNLSKVK